jgi:hypothetical protein
VVGRKEVWMDGRGREKSERLSRVGVDVGMGVAGCGWMCHRVDLWTVVGECLVCGATLHLMMGTDTTARERACTSARKERRGLLYTHIHLHSFTQHQHQHQHQHQQGTRNGINSTSTSPHFNSLTVVRGTRDTTPTSFQLYSPPRRQTWTPVCSRIHGNSTAEPAERGLDSIHTIHR